MTLDERDGYPSASSLPRIEDCPGSLKLEAFLAPALGRRETPWGIEGTYLHEVVEGAHESPDLSLEQQWAVEETDALKAAALRQIGYDPTRPMKEVREKRLWVHDAKLRPIYSGKIDIACFPERTVAVLIDWKFGRIAVKEASANAQLRGYAVAVAQHFPEVAEIYVCVAQPRQPKNRRLTLAYYDRPALAAAKEQIRSLLYYARNTHDPERNPSEEACRYCTAQHFCPEAWSHWADLTPPTKNT